MNNKKIEIKMSASRYWTVVWRLSLVTGGIIALFWVIWYLIVGSVPTTTSIRWAFDTVFCLPFPVSRWYDVLIGPIWSLFFALVFTHKKKDNEFFETGLKGGMFGGLFAGLAFVLIFISGFNLFHCVVICLSVGLSIGLIISLVDNQDIGPSATLGAGLVFSLISGLVVGLVYGLIIGLSFGLGFGLGSSIRTISEKIWKVIGGWLMAKTK